MAEEAWGRKGLQLGEGHCVPLFLIARRKNLVNIQHAGVGGYLLAMANFVNACLALTVINRTYALEFHSELAGTTTGA